GLNHPPGRCHGRGTQRSFDNKNKSIDAMRQIDVHTVIDGARFTRFHWMVMALCALLLIFDGYDLFIYGVVLP
ncbi:hypothetical protein LK12_23590, partial [Novosphingobium malaysiense]